MKIGFRNILTWKKAYILDLVMENCLIIRLLYANVAIYFCIIIVINLNMTHWNHNVYFKFHIKGDGANFSSRDFEHYFCP